MRDDEDIALFERHEDIALFERQEDIALFERHGDQFVPTLFTTGPWRPDAMNGGAPSALIGAVITEMVEEGERVAGVQIDLERPVPLEQLRVVVERRPQSRRISRLNVEVHAASGRVVAAKVLLLRGEPVGIVPSDEVAPPGPDELAPMSWVGQGQGDSPTFHVDAIEQRFVEGGFQVLGPAVAWLRLRGTTVAGEAPTALAQLLAVADFGSALSWAVLPGSGVGLINVDVNVSLFRSPVGPWFCLNSTGYAGEEGIGLAVTRLRDLRGPLGMISQSQISHRLPGAPA